MTVSEIIKEFDRRDDAATKVGGHGPDPLIRELAVNMMAMQVEIETICLFFEHLREAMGEIRKEPAKRPSVASAAVGAGTDD